MLWIQDCQSLLVRSDVRKESAANHIHLSSVLVRFVVLSIMLSKWLVRLDHSTSKFGFLAVLMGRGAKVERVGIEELDFYDLPDCCNRACR